MPDYELGVCADPVNYAQNFEGEPVGDYGKFGIEDGVYEQSAGVVEDDGGNHIFGPRRPSSLNARNIFVSKLDEDNEFTPLTKGFASVDFKMTSKEEEPSAGSTGTPVLIANYPSEYYEFDGLIFRWPYSDGLQMTLYGTSYGPFEGIDMAVDYDQWYHLEFQWVGYAYDLTVSDGTTEVFAHSGTLPGALGNINSFYFGAYLLEFPMTGVAPYDGNLDNIEIIACAEPSGPIDPGKEEPPETVVRQYPRDDALGLGSAPRIHPPPMRKRIHGGLQ